MKKFLLVIFSLLILTGWVKPALAADCPPGYQPYQWGGYPCGEKPANICCGSSGCADCEPWCYKYDPICCVKKDYGESYVTSIVWEYNHCSATDTCQGTPYLYAGRCDVNGCTVGGLYKTCCYSNGTVDGNCQGGQFTGTCPSGSTAVICGVSSCAGISAPCTTAACGTAACQAWFGAPTPPPGPTPTPISRLGEFG